jgi:hypothetical protein
MAVTEAPFLPGDVVKTLYGVGVITSCPKHLVDAAPETVAPSFRVLLWRIPGKSIGSSSVAYLQANVVSYGGNCLNLVAGNLVGDGWLTYDNVFALVSVVP